MLNRALSLMVLAAFGLTGTSALADGSVGQKGFLKPVTDAQYLEECGSCHFAYQAELLPKRSWEKMLSNLHDHFGDDASLEGPGLEAVKAYLLNNAGETSNSKRAIKLLQSTGDKTYLRISDIPYFKREHHEISPATLARPAIKSWANCAACHPDAAKGNFEEEYVKIPK
ncbi:MAG: hypothetical protein A2600_03400 [Candidatus Lambdaproteobacteria bacterium RIFOXYD1_FULL_56_27]|uniref:Cytochrome C n=1 Tax=Candidatus Lambdaproteobacteria bacterium RIFOXYD2_FULL_56_26 TaxID=1817773 RepID=A0A1F6H396_9PROT|nr:MAG: hypothetical protein A2426_11460 [Candidatus Lambdaproteobacteria bacterium RIFOXYC1_FULL_56_13]OGH04816.1 MAG: hypothetical protein A2557_07465 [Candidatus Lambdaproteobacteria bacterium RIFOXYD2_FULL_56_26]OGH09281.1 MAG: hypothetical protein A2600_03400 [Candidatus Lambdaproteobacteria bacterium RIFOXYD1_FULL_56_27]